MLLVAARLPSSLGVWPPSPLSQVAPAPCFAGAQPCWLGCSLQEEQLLLLLLLLQLHAVTGRCWPTAAQVRLGRYVMSVSAMMGGSGRLEGKCWPTAR